MLDDATPHVAVPVQVIRGGKVMATTLSDESGKYQLVDLKPGEYQLRCHILGGHIYYGEKKPRNYNNQAASSKPIILQIEQGEALRNIDFRFAQFKKGKL